MSLIREDSIFVSWQTRKGLGYVYHLEDCQSVDALAERVLADWLKEKHPDVVNHMKAQADADKAFRKIKCPVPFESAEAVAGGTL